MTTTLTSVWPARVRQPRRVSTRLDWFIYIMLGVIVVDTVIGPWVVPSSINDSHILQALQAPSSHHWLGTDQQGRDVLQRTIIGARASVGSAFIIVVAFSAIGVVVAVIATAFGSKVDQVMMRIVDSVMSIPPIIFALGVAAALGPSLKSAILALALTGWPYTARLLRGIMREVQQMPFVEGATVLGVSRFRLMWNHILRNSLDVLIVKWAGDIGTTILVLGSLSFVGVAAQPPSAEWGASITAAQSSLTQAWWPAFAPGIAIVLTGITFGLLGDILHRRFNPEAALRGR
jgi:peptide/nickel transport system permease protein